MTKPQQRELRRSGLGNTDQEALEMMARESDVPEVKGRTGRVPEDNRPGHHPPVDQDKPSGPPAQQGRART